MLHRCLKDKVNSHFMEWFCATFLFLNIVWAVYIAFSQLGVESYPNAVCGILVALTVPPPSSVYKGAPGWFAIAEGKRVDVVVPDHDWWWIGVYSSWNCLFAWTYTLNLWRVTLHLGSPLLYSAVMRSSQDWVMMRLAALYLLVCTAYPWQWFNRVMGESVVEDAMMSIVWGTLNLSGAVLYVGYYLYRVWKRVRSQRGVHVPV